MEWSGGTSVGVEVHQFDTQGERSVQSTGSSSDTYYLVVESSCKVLGRQVGTEQVVPYLQTLGAVVSWYFIVGSRCVATELPYDLPGREVPVFLMC